MGKGGHSGRRRYALIVLGTIATLSLVGCGGLGLLPYHPSTAQSSFDNYKEVAAAYARVVPGRTLASDLASIGFDASRSPDAKVLSYLGVMERFASRGSMKFDKLDPAIQSCIESRDRCTAYVFNPARDGATRAGSALLDMFGFESKAYSREWGAQVVFLIEDGRVAYKAISGAPGSKS